MELSLNLTGTDEVIKKLNIEILKMKGRTRGGVRAAGLLVLGESKLRTPVDTGNLRSSADETTTDELEGPVSTITYSASYAAAVHEINKNYTVGQWKYLQTAIQENTQQILDAIAERARF